MRALVTGATGFVGAAVARRLLARGHDVRVLARPKGDRRNLDGLHVEIVEGDLTDASSIARAVRGCGAVFHVAADYRLWVKEPKAMYAANVDGTRAVLQAAVESGVDRIVYTSSVATLGYRADGQPADEETPSTLDDMIGHYKRSKFLAEQVVREMAAAGAPVVTVNPSTPVGPGDIKPTPTGRMIRNAINGKMPAYVDTGLNIVHVDDVATGHLLAYERGQIGRRYVLGGKNMTLREILTDLARVSGRRPPKWRLSHRAVLPIAYLAEGWAHVSGREPLTTVDGVRLSAKTMYFSSARAEHELGYTASNAHSALKECGRVVPEGGRRMDLILAQPRGFCAGVVRAKEIVERTLQLRGSPVYVLHEIVHNRRVVEDLEECGAIFVEDLNEVPAGAVLIFSAHGVGRKVEEDAAARGLRVLDATCPLVTKVHLQAQRYAKDGRELIIVGHAGHVEVAGTLGQVERAHVLCTVAEVEQLVVGDPDQLAYVTQTTLSIDDTREVVDALKARFPTIKGPGLDDICYATQNRQNAVKEMSATANVLLVVGARNSSNSNRLREVGAQHRVPSYLIEGAEDIDPAWLPSNGGKVAITAGASTPEVLVDQVIERLRSMGIGSISTIDGVKETTTFRLPAELTQLEEMA